MLKGQPKFGLPTFPNFFTISFKIVLGVLLLTFLTGYQPTLGFPPLKQNTALAQNSPTQEVKINAQESSLQFQLMFPGYLSQGYSNYHPALDIATGLGMPIKPISTGKVISAGYDFWGYGLKVEIDHGNGYKSLYAHLGKTYVQEGQEISSMNSFIGEVGMTGRTSGPHTHLEVTKDGNTVNAQAILPELRQYAIEQDFQPVGGKGLKKTVNQKVNSVNTPTLEVKKEAPVVKTEQSVVLKNYLPTPKEKLPQENLLKNLQLIH